MHQDKPRSPFNIDSLSIRPLQEKDLASADLIMRVAFGTFMGLPDPASFMGDASYVRTRWRTDPASGFGAFIDGELVGSNFGTNWGSVGFFGPLTVHPDLWDKGVAKRLMEPIMNLFAQWRTTQAGLFTFAQSKKHVGLYQRFGFWPRYLTALMSKPVTAHKTTSSNWFRYSEDRQHQAELLKSCRQITTSVYPGLDLEREIRGVHDQKLGDTVFIRNADSIVGFAVCHHGPGTEAGSNTCYVKFGVVQADSNSNQNFEKLLIACEEFASFQGLGRLFAGVNTGRHEAYRMMIKRGFKTDMQGVAMHLNNEEGYNRPGIYLLDDWR